MYLLPLTNSQIILHSLFSHINEISIGRHLLTILDGTLVAAVVNCTSADGIQAKSGHGTKLAHITISDILKSV